MVPRLRTAGTAAAEPRRTRPASASTRWARIAGVSAVMAAAALVLAQPALLDIYRGEPDLVVAWRAIRIAVLTTAVSIGTTLALVRAVHASGRGA